MIKFKAAIIVAVSALLVGAGIYARAGKKQKGLDGSDAALAQRANDILEFAVRDNLKDPMSALFREEQLYKQGITGYNLCGEVNSKNGFGGYSGFHHFVAVLAYDYDAKKLWKDVVFENSEKFANLSIRDPYLDYAEKYCHNEK